jgi:MFS family permease
MSLSSRLPRAVFALGVVSFFTDLSSEMIYPLLPVFLVTVLGAGALSLGVIEGAAESTASLLKVVSGIWSDRLRRRKPLVLFGYSLSGLARPLIGLAVIWPAVLALRVVDRVGKGVRTSPRDALIADVTPPEQRGRAYGLHRAMDHAGAVAGPLVAAGLLGLLGLGLRDVFLLAALPAVVVVVTIVLFVPEPSPIQAPTVPATTRGAWQELGSPYRRLLLAVVVFTLGNSTDAFLLLRLSEARIGATALALLWSLHSLVKMTATYYGGRFSDRLGHRRMLIAGWLVYAAIYLAFAKVTSAPALVAVFLAYGLYFGLTEPAEKALVSQMAPATLRGTAFGYYHGAVGLAALPASLLFGLLWQAFGAPVAFAAGAALAALACVLMLPRRVPA